MTDERSKTPGAEGRASSQPVTREHPRALLPPRRTEEAVLRPLTAAPEPRTLTQAEEGSTTAKRETVEQRRKAKAKENLEVGGTTTVFGLSVLLALFCLSKEAKHQSNTRFTVSLLLAFATVCSGMALMLLSTNMLGLPETLVSGGQRVASKCLFVVCSALSGLTLVSLLALLPGWLYMFIGLGVVTAIALLVAAVHWYLNRRAGGGDEAAAHEEHEELESACKTTSAVTNSAFGGLVGVLFSASKMSASATGAVYAAIFFMFATAIFGMFVMTVSKKVPEITSRRLRRFLARAIRLANGFLLCSLACAAFAASFVVLGSLIFVAFAPLVITAVVCFVLRHCIVGRGSAGMDNQEHHEARIKAMEDMASKVTTATMAAIMSVLGGFLGEKDHQKMGAMDVIMVVLTSAFVSGFGFMLLAAVPSSARARLAPTAKVLAWSSMALFAATAVTIYGLEILKAH